MLSANECAHALPHEGLNDPVPEPQRQQVHHDSHVWYVPPDEDFFLPLYQGSVDLLGRIVRCQGRDDAIICLETWQTLLACKGLKTLEEPCVYEVGVDIGHVHRGVVSGHL